MQVNFSALRQTFKLKASQKLLYEEERGGSDVEV